MPPRLRQKCLWRPVSGNRLYEAHTIVSHRQVNAADAAAAAAVATVTPTELRQNSTEKNWHLNRNHGSRNSFYCHRTIKPSAATAASDRSASSSVGGTC